MIGHEVDRPGLVDGAGHEHREPRNAELLTSFTPRLQPLFADTRVGAAVWLLLVWGWFSVSGCEQQPGRIGVDQGPTHSSRFAHEEPREALRARLVAQGVRFRELPDGTLVFDEPDDARINVIVAGVAADFYAGPSVTVTGEEAREQMLALFAASGVPVRVIHDGSEYRISWSDRHESAARNVIEEFKSRQRAATVQRLQQGNDP